MLHFTEFSSYDFDLEKTKTRKGVSVYNEIFTFDIEVTSCYYINGSLVPFDFTKDKEYYKDIQKICFMYIWQYGINDVVFYGRTWKDLILFFEMLDKKYPLQKITYVHNLAYEFQFLLNILESDDTLKEFARKPHKVMKFELSRYGLLFKCSYILCNMSLEKVAGSFKLPVKKLVGDLDYYKIRFHTTKLTDKELQYCENDLLVMYHFLLRYKEKYKNVHDIPLTQTGEVRRVVKNMYKNNSNYYRKVWQQQPKDFKELQLLTSVFMGGYTHANAIHSGHVIENVQSKDISSSYPTVMICEKFPSSSFFPIRNYDIKELEKTFDDYAYILEVEFIDIKSVIFNNYISVSKCYNRKGVVEDNGRLVKAEKITLKITEIDYTIIKNTYQCKEINIINVYRAEKNYLDKDLILLILELFGNKTKLKDIPEFDDLYMQSKQYINSLFGMCVTNNITDDIIFQNFEWQKIALTEEKANEILNRMKKSRNTFLNFSWGVYITAYARRNLWLAIQEIDFDVIYCDTDSVKFTGDYDYFFNEYNKNIVEKMKVALTQLSIDNDLLYPKDSKGKTHLLGIFDTEKTCTKFKTLGAKKYIAQYGNDYKITVSGVNKKAVKQIKSIYDFDVGLIFYYENSGRLIMSYLSELPTLKVKDEQGNEIILQDKYGIHAQPTTYELGLSDTYEDYLTTLANTESEVADIRK